MGLIVTIAAMLLGWAACVFVPLSDLQVHCLAGLMLLLGISIGWQVGGIARRRW